LTADIGWIPVELEQRSDDGEALHRLALLSGIGLGTPHDPPLAVARLRRAAALGHDTAVASLTVLNAEPGGLEAWFRPPAPRVASETPHILLIDGFVSSAVCDWIRSRAEPHLKPAEIYDPISGAGRPDPVRTNTAFAFHLASTDLVLVLVRERIARLAGLPVPGLEPSQALRYTPGQKFDWHVDFLDPAITGTVTTWRARARGSPPV
jgi:prolyl 4-hydroxylase